MREGKESKRARVARGKNKTGDSDEPIDFNDEEKNMDKNDEEEEVTGKKGKNRKNHTKFLRLGPIGYYHSTGALGEGFC